MDDPKEKQKQDKGKEKPKPEPKKKEEKKLPRGWDAASYYNPGGNNK